MRNIIGAVLLSVSAGLVQAQDVTLQTARGEVTVPATPDTVVTLDLAILDTLSALDVPVAGVPGGTKPDHLASYTGGGAMELGSPFEPDIEALMGLAPDLVLLAGRSSTKYDEIAALVPTVDLTSDTTQLLASVRRNVTTLGALFGKDAAAAQVLAGLDAKFAAVRAKTETAGTALVILTTGGRMSTHGAQGRFATIFNDMGFTPAIAEIEAGTHGQPISNEFILETNPDWIFVIDRDAAIGRDGQPARALLDNPLVQRTKAWAKEQVVFLDAADWYLVGAGPTALNRSLDQIAAALEE